MAVTCIILLRMHKEYLENMFIVLFVMRTIVINFIYVAVTFQWAAKTRRSYTMDVLEEVRLETLEFIENFM